MSVISNTSMLYPALLEHARHLSSLVTATDTILLTGDVGAGKTTYVRHFMQTLSSKDNVHSPTYTLMHSYKTATQIVWHLDLYRILDDQERLWSLGLEEIVSKHLTFIEWPDIDHIHNFTNCTLHLNITLESQDPVDIKACNAISLEKKRRMIKAHSTHPRWIPYLEGLSACL